MSDETVASLSISISAEEAERGAKRSEKAIDSIHESAVRAQQSLDGMVSRDMLKTMNEMLKQLKELNQVMKQHQAAAQSSAQSSEAAASGFMTTALAASNLAVNMLSIYQNTSKLTGVLTSLAATTKQGANVTRYYADQSLEAVKAQIRLADTASITRGIMDVLKNSLHLLNIISPP